MAKKLNTGVQSMDFSAIRCIPAEFALADPNLVLSMLAFVAKECLERDWSNGKLLGYWCAEQRSIGKHWKHRNALINRLVLVCKEWRHTITPTNGWVRLQSFYRCVIVRKHVTAADMRQWWRIVRVAGDVRNPAIYNTTDAAIQTLAQGCAGLTNVNMFGCRNITDAAIEALAQHCAGLTNVSMGGCRNITDAAIEALAQHCAGLTSVDISDCSNITDAAIQALAQHCAGLTSVNMWSCDITDAAIEALAQHCAGLTNVDMSGCSNITDAAIQALKLQFPEIIVRR